MRPSVEIGAHLLEHALAHQFIELVSEAHIDGHLAVERFGGFGAPPVEVFAG